MGRKWYVYLALLAALLALGVIVLGAYVRLSQAGLGCPDWPGCYGHLSVPDTHAAVARADALYAGRPLHAARAWKEMIHRYFAGSLAVLILILALAAWWLRIAGRAKNSAASGSGQAAGVQAVVLPSLALLTVIFQALLGMWTVTLLLFPPVVMGHLLGGYLTFALLVLLVLQTGGWLRAADSAGTALRWLAGVTLVVLVCQIALGGWVSSNYAGIACPDFPTCQGQWWPPMDFHDAFSWQGLGPDYQGGLLSDPARVAIHVTHRLGALATLVMVIVTGLLFLIKGRRRALKCLGALAILLVLAQVGIGVSMVHFALPLALTDSHTGVAALLLGTVVAWNWAVSAKPLAPPSGNP
ncbi:MAG: COX15/CtaA family protein [Gammaproteobacteria bacterium]|nr:COX15/CtaA family protein [Gammaproteobacteria bacterium]